MSWGEIKEEELEAQEIMKRYVPRPRLGESFRMKVRAGCYILENGFNENYISEPAILDIASDEMILMRNDCINKIQHEIRDFWTESTKKIYEEAKLLHKRGLLLFGDPGSGKTSLIKQEVIRLIKEEDQVVFMARSPYRVCESMRIFRELEPYRKLIVILEDIDEIVRSYGEQELLEMMDGVYTVNHVLFIATTNNPERLSPKMKREGRFDRKIEIPLPEYKLRKTYLDKKAMGRLTEDQIKVFAKQTKGMSFGQLRELVISICGYRIPITEAISRMKKENLLTENKKLPKNNKIMDETSYDEGDECYENY